MIGMLMMVAAWGGGQASAISPIEIALAADRVCMAAEMARARSSSGSEQLRAQMALAFFYGRLRGRGGYEAPPDGFWSGALNEIGSHMAAEQARCDAAYRAEIARLPPPP